jgi:hypothetical protein
VRDAGRRILKLRKTSHPSMGDLASVHYRSVDVFALLLTSIIIGLQAAAGFACCSENSSNQKLKQRPCSPSYRRLTSISAATASQCSTKSGTSPDLVLRLANKRGGPGCLNSFSASISGASAGVGCRAEWQRGEVGLIGCHAVKARTWSSAVVKVEVGRSKRGLG